MTEIDEFLMSKENSSLLYTFINILTIIDVGMTVKWQNEYQNSKMGGYDTNNLDAHRFLP